MRIRNKLIINILATIIILFTGCTSNTQTTDLAICGSFGVPGMFCVDLKGSAYECVVLEEDTQGRVLYSYTTQSVITGKKEKAVVICQQRNAEAVYYYEDICYLLGEWTQDDLVLLKERNDWNLPLDYSKTTSKDNKRTLDGYIATKGDLEYKQVQQACCKELGIMQQQIEELCFLDTDSSKMELYWLVANEDSGKKSYFVLVNDNYHVVVLCAERNMNALTDLVSFKQNNGWGNKAVDGSVVP